ncbi:uncharacterized protein K02A2.6-like [Macrobrachium nipponense]|uniref:uncharacterized protein K02A2.6-like n=1 Tax=Macrobrachium nipponense TaxID=159736 RepID=UPI0030C8587C
MLHLGSMHMKELAHSYFWWAKLDSDLESLKNSCPECLSLRAMPPKAELHPWGWPTHPWHRLHIDYAGPVGGRYFLVVVDAHSKWVYVYPTSNKSPAELMFGRRLQSRLDLLWPADGVSSTVMNRQQAQKTEHTGTPPKLHLPPESPMMIQNYTPGNVVKRHQDQMITRTIPPSPQLTPLVDASANLPTRPLVSDEATQLSSPTIQESVEPASHTSPYPSSIRRSSWTRRPVIKMDL